MHKLDRPPVRNYSSAREQWRLLLLIVPLGVVIILLAKLRDPQVAERIDNLFAPTKPRPVVAETARNQPPTSPPVPFPGLRTELLPTITDHTYFRHAETDAWFHFIELVQQASPDELAPARARRVDYVQFVDQPSHYRGKLVTVAGWVRQITEQTPAANELGLESYYRVVMQPGDGARWPIIAYSLERPAEMPASDPHVPNAQVTGLFFKNLSYRWQDGLGTAPVIVAQRIEPMGDSAFSVPALARLDQDDQLQHPSVPESSAAQEAMFREILALAGWDEHRLAELDDGEQFTNQQRDDALELLRRLRSFDQASLASWARDAAAANQVLANPDEHRGQLTPLSGRVTSVTRHTPEPADAERLELPEYYECQVMLDGDAGVATILTARVPQAWLHLPQLDEPVTANALYLKRLPNNDPAAAVWLARHVAWHPTGAREPHVSFGASVLGRLGMDVGLLDAVDSRGRLRTADPTARAQYNEQREAFYQMLDAVGRTEPHQLIQLADGNLPAVKEKWQRELAAAQDETRRALAREVVRRAAQGRYSVAPLFNEPDQQIGRLIVVDGVARRAVRVEVGASPEADEPSDVARRFGIDHYYELQVFTDDSQNYPLVFCVRELPDGFPIGGEIHVPVRVAGFFLKNWLYQTRGSAEAAGAHQLAPLLIGPAPVVLAVEQGGAAAVQWLLGGLFVLVLAGIAAVAVWHARSDRRFRDSVLAGGFSLPPGQSLDELNVPSAVEPMNSGGNGPSDTPNSSELQ